MYKRSVEDPAGFWSEIASQFYWREKWYPEVYSENIDVTKGTVKFEVGCVIFQLGLFIFMVCRRRWLLYYCGDHSGLKEPGRTSVTMLWIRMLRQEMVEKLLSIGKAMNQGMMGSWLMLNSWRRFARYARSHPKVEFNSHYFVLFNWSRVVCVSSPTTWNMSGFRKEMRWWFTSLCWWSCQSQC